LAALAAAAAGFGAPGLSPAALSPAFAQTFDPPGSGWNDGPRGEEAAKEGPAPVDDAVGEPQPTKMPPAIAARKRAARPMPSPALSDPVVRLADWAIATDDNAGLPFLIIDKVDASIFVFDADGQLQSGAPALVGLARGDDSAAGVGSQALANIRPDERTTPAGRFVAGFGPASGDREVLWVDYDDAISLHPVVTSNPRERRPERIRSLSPEDHRISYGCINVPARFYQDVVLKAFAGGKAIVYILPDTKPLEEVFPGIGSAAPFEAVTLPAESSQETYARDTHRHRRAALREAAFDPDEARSAAAADPPSDDAPAALAYPRRGADMTAAAFDPGQDAGATAPTPEPAADAVADVATDAPPDVPPAGTYPHPERPQHTHPAPPRHAHSRLRR
jgi:hypothetical protein